MHVEVYELLSGLVKEAISLSESKREKATIKLFKSSSITKSAIKAHKKYFF